MKKIHYFILFNLIAMALFSCNQSTVKKKRFPPQEFFTGELLPLAQAIYDDDAAKVKAYIQSRSIDVNSADSNSIAGYTLLLYSINVGSKKAMKTLLEMGADPNRVSQIKAYDDSQRKSYQIQDTYPLENATYHSDLYFAKLLFKYGANPQLGLPLHASLINTPENSTTQMLQFLLDNGANINKQDAIMQETPLLSSLSMHRNEYSTFFINRGADLTIVDNQGLNAPESLQELIDNYSKRYGYDVNKSLEYLGRWQTTITAMQKQGYVFTYLINENDRVVYEGKK